MLRKIFSMSFYAVRCGRTPGIYRDWDSCKAQVEKFSGARYKKFKTAAEAKTFISQGENSNQEDQPDEEVACSESIYSADKLPFEPQPLGPQSKKRQSSARKTEPPPKRVKSEAKSSPTVDDVADEVDKRKPVDVYTDGACIHNGKPHAKAAIGVFWGLNSPLNVSERLPGRQTNNRAEIHAARKAIEQARAMGRNNVRLFTDSQFLINSMTKWVRNWMKNGWKLINGHPVINKEDFIQLMEASEGMKITWIKVAGHKGVFGNEWADKLAVDALKKPLPTGTE